MKNHKVHNTVDRSIDLKLFKLSIYSHSEVKCGPTDGVLNGQVVPSKCGTVGAQFGDSCNLYCSNGFKLKGTGKITCMADKTYDNSFDHSECIKSKNIVFLTDVFQQAADFLVLYKHSFLHFSAVNKYLFSFIF